MTALTALGTIVATMVTCTHAPAAAASGMQPGGERPYSRSAPAPGYTITFAARQCPEYTDVMANRGRNNIQEALRDVGKDTGYPYGQGVDPATEEANDPHCTPIVGWKFQLGSSYDKTGQLSNVTGPTGTTVTTLRRVPILNDRGIPTGEDLAGAVTHTLSAQEITLAQRNALWVQGGVVGDPQLTKIFGKGAYGFAALRCSVDNNNNDNVEYASFPSQVRHVYCFAYYVNPEPGSGEIVIRKEIAGQGITQRFTFASDLSYDPSGTFRLDVNRGKPAEQSFIRADSAAFGKPYDVREHVPDGWRLIDLTCTATRARGTAASTWTIDKTTASVAITLADRDRVVCTYLDAPPNDPGLDVWKVTSGMPGGPFRFEVTGPVSHTLTATTTAAEEPVKTTLADGTAPDDYKPGDYTITEEMPPPTAAGRWRYVQAYCQGRVIPPVHGAPTRQGQAPQVHVTLFHNFAQDCVFRNAFIPNGRIILRLKTIGGTGTGHFVRTAAGQPAQVFAGVTTSQDSVPATASDDRDLSFQKYQVYSVAPLAKPQNGTWRFVSFSCSRGSATGIGPQSLRLDLTEAAPTADCTAVYQFLPSVTVQVIKIAHGAGRSGPAVIEISCGGDRAGGRVVLAVNASHAELPAPLHLYDPATCQVSEPSSGAVPAAHWTVRAAVNGTPLALPGSFEVRADGTRSYTVRVTDGYHLPVDCRAAIAVIRALPGC